jgi:hypothetical protein
VKVPNFKTTGFMLIDIGMGRLALAKYFDKKRKLEIGYGYTPVNKPIKVLIEAEITDRWGADDGISIEFEATIKKMKIKPTA